MVRNGIKSIVCLCMAAAGLSASAQDVIVKRDGSTVLSKVLEITTSEVKYKKWSNRDGPTYSVSKAELLSVNYENGDKDDFSQIADANVNNGTAAANAAPAAASLAPAPKMAEAEVEEMNAKLRAAYNQEYISFNDDRKGKKAGNYLCQYFVTDDSRFADEYVEIKCVPILGNSLRGPYTNMFASFVNCSYNWDFELQLKNKSDQTIYIDLGNTFMTYGGEAMSLYTPTATSTTSGSTTGAGVNLGSVAGALGVGGAVGKLAGGVNVGGSSTKSTTSITYAQRVVSLPPHSGKTMKVKVCPERQGGYYPATKEQTKARRSGDRISFENGDLSSLDRSFHLSYAFSEDCASPNTLHINFYVKNVWCLRRSSLVPEAWSREDVEVGSCPFYLVFLSK